MTSNWAMSPVKMELVSTVSETVPVSIFGADKGQTTFEILGTGMVDSPRRPYCETAH